MLEKHWELPPLVSDEANAFLSASRQHQLQRGNQSDLSVTIPDQENLYLRLQTGVLCALQQTDTFGSRKLAFSLPLSSTIFDSNVFFSESSDIRVIEDPDRSTKYTTELKFSVDSILRFSETVLQSSSKGIYDVNMRLNLMKSLQVMNPRQLQSTNSVTEMHRS